jgi:hypothetical protein
MCLLLIFLLCAAITGRFAVPNNSRFGTIDSRLGAINGNKIPGSPLREFFGNALIWPMILQTNGGSGAKIDEFPGFTGIAGN